MAKLFAAIILSLGLFTTSLNAQIHWQSDVGQAVKLAQMSNRLIVLDFWAIWCGPCRMMDRDVWNTDDMAKLADNFVFAKVDTDVNKADATRFGITALPTIIVMDIEQNILVQLTGYQDLKKMMELMEAYPADLSKAYAHIKENMGSEQNFQAHIDAAMVYMQYAGNVEHREVRTGLVNAANDHFKKAGKVAKDPVEKEAAEIYMALAKSIHKPEKALKAISKLYEETTGQNEALFAFAFCSGYLENGQMKEAKMYYEKVSQSRREDLLASLRIRFDSSD